MTTKRDKRGTPVHVPIGTLETHVGDSYIVGKRVGEGASGVVYEASDIKKEKTLVAVKFYLIPTQVLAWGTTDRSFWTPDEDEEVYNNEQNALQELHHSGIQQVLGWGSISDAAAKFAHETSFVVPPGDRVRFLVTKYVRGTSISTWIDGLASSSAKATAPQRFAIRTRVIAALVQLLESLTYLHETKHHQHSDIRPENVMIESASDRPILIDFGYAQIFDDELLRTSPMTRVRPLRLLNGPKEIEQEITALCKPGTLEIDRGQLRDLLFPGLDLFQLGGLLLSLLDDHQLEDLITPLDASFLRLICSELTNWRTVKGLKTSDLLAHISKLKDGYWSAASAPHSPQLAPGQPVRRIALSDASFMAPRTVERLIETESFRRLRSLKQLSLLDFVYPSATQSRFDHCLTVYSTGVEMVQGLVRSPRFTKLFDTQAVSELLLCALLHDINHFPFLHYCQELALARGTGNLFELFVKKIGGAPTPADIIADAGADPDRIIRILSARYADLTDPQEQVIKSILDSGVDIDKLSYVQGDARTTGVPFGLGVDRRALLTAADVLRQPPSTLKAPPHWHLCFEPHALSAVESLLFARYWNFRQIYWHHTNRALGAMVSHVLGALADAGHLNLEQYIRDTLGFTESAALAYLDSLHQAKLGTPSVVHALVTKRAGLFKRLLSMKVPWGTANAKNADEQRRLTLVTTLKGLGRSARLKAIHEFADELPTMFPVLKERVPKGETDEKLLVLIDIPGRPLDDDMGQVFLAHLNPDGSPAHVVESPFVPSLQKEFLNLSRTVRLFVPAAVRDRIGKEQILAAQVELEVLLHEKVLGGGDDAKSTVS